MQNSDPADLMAKRYRSAPKPLLVESLVTPSIETMLAHRSVRKYKTDALETGVLELLVAAAQSASTSSNLQTYSIIACRDKGRKNELSVLCGDQKQVHDCPLFLLFCADLARLEYVCTSTGSADAGLDYIEMLIMSIVDASLAAQNMTIAAESMGLGTCYIGGARNHPIEIAHLLNLPNRVFILFGLTVGMPLTGEEEIKPRLPQLPGILHKEQYNSDYEASIHAYETALLNYNDTMPGRQGRGWRETTAARVATPEALGADRPRIKEILEQIRMGLL